MDGAFSFFGFFFSRLLRCWPLGITYLTEIRFGQCGTEAAFRTEPHASTYRYDIGLERYKSEFERHMDTTTRTKPTSRWLTVQLAAAMAGFASLFVAPTSVVMAASNIGGHRGLPDAWQ